MKKNTLFSRFSLIDGITLFFIFTMSVTLIGSISSIYYTQNVYNGLKSMYENDLLGANYIQISRIALVNIENSQKTLLISESGKDIEKNIQKIQYFEQELMGNIMRADPLFGSPKGKVYITEAAKSARAYITIIAKIIDLNSANQKKKALSISLNEANIASGKLDHLLDRMDDYKQEKNLKFYSTSVFVYKANLAISFLLLTGSVIIRIIFYRKQKKGNKNCK